MFESIKLVSSSTDDDNNIFYHYEIKDTNFNHVVTLNILGLNSYLVYQAAISVCILVAVIETYKYKKCENIIPNLFLCNLYIQKYFGYTLDEILDYQKHIDKCFSNINVNEKYYDDLVKYTKKMMVIS